MTKNEIDRERIRRDTEAFLASGGEIRTVTAFDNAEAGLQLKRVKNGSSSKLAYADPASRQSQPRVKP